jgi:ribose/xylose/arabinose/galactoside ABC-type transport system permease subunit
MGMMPAILMVLLMGVIVGTCNGIGVTKLGLPPMIMTMATQFICRGIALIIRPRAGGSIPKPVYKFFTWKSGPFSTMLFVILIATILMFYILQCSRFGRKMYAIGGNPVAARKNGIDVDTNTIAAYVITALFAVVAGIIVAARMGSADAYCGDTYALDSITATVIGGTGMEGGVGGVTGTLGGAILVAILSNVMNMLRIDTMAQYLVRGAILILALVIHFDNPSRSASKKVGKNRKQEEKQKERGDGHEQ